MSKSNPPETHSRDASLAAPENIIDIIPPVGYVGWVNNNGATNSSAIVVTGPQFGEYELNFGPMLNNSNSGVMVSAYIFRGRPSLSVASAQLTPLILNLDNVNVQNGPSNQLAEKTLTQSQEITWYCTTPASNISFPCSILAQGFIVNGPPPNESLTNYLNAYRADIMGPDFAVPCPPEGLFLAVAMGHSDQDTMDTTLSATSVKRPEQVFRNPDALPYLRGLLPLGSATVSVALGAELMVLPPKRLRRRPPGSIIPVSSQRRRTVS